ncbi:cupin domain-containing protein [Nocardia sp. R6R-6]|uniref:cupin domain-containing protein n=1 Tax=Nocardia sp. R6R-6 TaxID=3459303 RepID=UPI00403DD1B0
MTFYFFGSADPLPGANVTYLLRAGEGHNIATSELGDRASIKASGAESEGRLAMLEYTAAAGGRGPDPHTHDHHEELFYIVSGELKMLVGDEVVTCGPGDFAYVPRNVVHTFWNEGADPCTFVGAFSPAGFERIFEYAQEAAKAGRRRTPEEMNEIAQKYDMKLVAWPPGTAPNFVD